MKNVKSKRPLLLPVGFFLIFIIEGAIKLYKGIVEHNNLHIAMSAIGIVVSIIGIIMIVPHFKKEVKTL